MKRAMFDFIPDYCPNCGKPLELNNRKRRDLFLKSTAIACKNSSCDFILEFIPQEDFNDLHSFYKAE